MKANELKYGNFVRIKRTGEIVIVNTVTKHKVGYHYNSSNNLSYSRLYEIEPIEINEDFLIYLGFEKTPQSESYKEFNVRYIYYEDPVQIQFRLYDTDHYKKYSHLFRGHHLTGKNLETFTNISCYILNIHELQQKLLDLNIKCEFPVEDIKKIYQKENGNIDT